MLIQGTTAVLAASVLLIGIMTRFLAAWFARLDTESRFRLSHFAFEDPSSPARVAPPSLFAAPTKSLSVVIPAYNEEDRLPNTLEETLAYLQRRRDRQGPNFTYEVVIVDDGSRDATVASANRFVRRHGFDAVRVLRLPENRGKGYAVKAGMLCCRGRDVLFMDADGATRVSEVEALEAQLQEVLKDSSQKLEKMDAVRTAATTPPSPAFKGGVGGDEELDDRRKDGAGMARRGAPGYYASSDRRKGGIGGGEEDTRLGFVLGSRAHLQDAALAKRTWIRNFLMHGFHFLVTLVVGGTIRDTQCGFKLMTRPAAQLLFPNQRLQRWAFDVELVHLAQVLKVPMAEVQVTWTEIPGSKVRLTSIAHMAFELAMLKIAYGSGIWRVHGPNEVNKRE